MNSAVTWSAALAMALLLSACQPHERAPAPAGHPPGDTPATFDSTGPEGAIDAVRRYYGAIDGRDFRAAYALWARDGTASGKTFEEFAAGFARTAHASVEITGPVAQEGAAGSSYAEVPVRVQATLTSGEVQRFEGRYVLRRVNDVPGATPEQLRWHIDSARLSATP